METRNAGLTMEYITRTFVREADYIVAARAEGETAQAGHADSPYGAFAAVAGAHSGAKIFSRLARSWA